MAQRRICLPVPEMQEIQVLIHGWEDPLGVAEIQASTPVFLPGNPLIEELISLQSMGPEDLNMTEQLNSNNLGQ